MHLFGRKHSKKRLEKSTAHNTGTQGIRNSEAVGKRPATMESKRVDGVMEQWLDVPTGNQKSDGSGERG
jgi:hypothetical protein